MGHMMPESISAIIIVCNEIHTLQKAVEEVLAALRPLERDYEVLIIDDGSTDGSLEIAETLAGEHEKVRLFAHPTNLGLGAVYRTGFREARKDIIYFMAADLQPIPALYMETFLPLFENHDMVVSILDRCRNLPFLHCLLSTLEYIVFRLLFPKIPKIGGPLMFRRRILTMIDLELAGTNEERGWMVLWELVIRTQRANLPIATVPTRRRPRTHDKSKGTTWRNGLVMLLSLPTLFKALRRP